MEILDPTHEEAAPVFAPASRLRSLEGAIVGILSNGKQGTTPFFDAVEHELVDSYGVATVVRHTKPNYSAPAGSGLMDKALRWNALIAGIGD